MKNKITVPKMGSLRKTLQDVFGHNDFQSALQKEACQVIDRKSRDALVCILSNSEKNICMQLPSAVSTSNFAVVITPTRDFAKRQVKYLKGKNIAAYYWNACSSTRAKSFIKAQMTAEEPKLKLLYVTYEQVLTNSHIQFKLFQAKRNVSTFIIDEADYLSSESSEFRSAYRKLGILRKKFPEIPIVAFTTSEIEKVRKDIIQVLQLQSPLILENKISAGEEFSEPEVIILDSDSGESIEFVGEERCTNQYKLCKHEEPSIKLFKLCNSSKRQWSLVGEECPSCNNKQEDIKEILNQIKTLIHNNDNDASEDSDVICITDDSAESPLLFSDSM